MKLKYSTFYMSLFILCSSCSPIFIRYNLISNNINSEVGKKNSSPILFECEITQGHYPDKKVKNFVKITIQNLSSDTIFFDQNQYLNLTSKVDAIDTTQLKRLLSLDFKRFLLPKGELSSNHEYWSNSFQGSIKKLINILRNEEIKIQIAYKNNDDSIPKNFILLKPDLKRFKKL